MSGNGQGADDDEEVFGPGPQVSHRSSSVPKELVIETDVGQRVSNNQPHQSIRPAAIQPSLAPRSRTPIVLKQEEPADVQIKIKGGYGEVNNSADKFRNLRDIIASKREKKKVIRLRIRDYTREMLRQKKQKVNLQQQIDEKSR